MTQVYNLVMEKEGKIKIVILAGGKGTRMNHNLPKMLVPLGGKPMLRYVVETANKITDKKPVLIVGYMAELIKKEFGNTCIYAGILVPGAGED